MTEPRHQPTWICNDCASERVSPYAHGNRLYTWHEDKCDYCGETRPVIAVRYCGPLKATNE